MLFGKLLEPLGNFVILGEHIGRLIRILFHIEKREPDLGLLVFARLPVVGCLYQGSIPVWKVQLPPPVAGYYPLEIPSR